MNVYIYNNAKCGATAWNDDVTYEAPCDFSDINAAIAWLEEEIDVKQQAVGGSVYDLNTGELYATCSWDDGSIPEEDYGSWDDNDPYDVEWDDHYWDDGCPIEDASYLGEDGYAIDDDVDESNYDPYAGCDMYEVEPIDY